VAGFRHLYSKGVEGRVGGHLYSLTAESDESRPNEINEIIATRIVIRKDGEPISEILLGDSLKEDAKFVVTELKRRGYSLYILSGDKESNVRQVASGGKYRRRTHSRKRHRKGNRRSSGAQLVHDDWDRLNDSRALSCPTSVAIQSVGRHKRSRTFMLENDSTILT
jgi:hypothetical protein